MKEKFLCLADSHLRTFRQFSARTQRGGGLVKQTQAEKCAVEAYMIDHNLSERERQPSHVDETPDFRTEQQLMNSFVEAGYIGFTSPTLRGLVVQNPAQPKVYANLHISIRQLENFQDIETAKYLTAYLDDLFSHCLPPGTDPSPPLMWWDSVRYFLHGQTTLNIKKLTYSQTRQASQGLNTPLTLEVCMRKLNIFFDRRYFDLKSFDFIVTVESKDSQKNMLSMRRVTSRRANMMPTGGSSRGRFSRPNMQQQKQILRWNLCNIPCIGISLACTPATNHSDNTSNEVYRDGLYDHHDVYCRPAFEDSNESRMTHSNYDRFAHFRMKRKSSKWGIVINFNDAPENVILLFFRLDIIERLKNAFSGPAIDASDDYFHKIVKFQEETRQFLFGECLDYSNGKPYSHEEEAKLKENFLLARKRYADSLVNDITMCITDLNVHVKLDKFLACSWPSSLILDGAVFSQDSLRVDAQLVNCDIEDGEEIEQQPKEKAMGRKEGNASYHGELNSTYSYEYPITSLQLRHVNGSIEHIEVYLRGR